MNSEKTKATNGKTSIEFHTIKIHSTPLGNLQVKKKKI